MTEASLAMVVASALILAMNVWLLRRRAPAHDLRGHRDHAVAMIAIVLSALVGPILVIALLDGLTHGSELSNLGDGVLGLGLAALHLFGWPIVALAVRRG